MEKSKFLNLNLRDLGNGLLVTFVAAFLITFERAFVGVGFSIFADGQQLLSILEVATSAGLAYIVKNLFENSTGQLGRRE